jgi:hypothetical protein
MKRELSLFRDETHETVDTLRDVVKRKSLII